jgi:phosphoribosylanthranilate isomerase
MLNEIPMVRVKVCGVTRADDVGLCARLGAHAVGFNFYSGSRRFVVPEVAREAVRGGWPFLYCVGVFVNEPDVEKVKWIASYVGLHALQFHGDESPEYCGLFNPYPVIKAFRVGDDFKLQSLESYRVSAVLLDGLKTGEYGGTGIAADWALAAEASRRWPVVLSGGLHPENVVDAVRQIQPLAVDVCSGVEAAPGIKDPLKLAAFMAALRAV